MSGSRKAASHCISSIWENVASTSQPCEKIKTHLRTTCGILSTKLSLKLTPGLRALANANPSRSSWSVSTPDCQILVTHRFGLQSLLSLWGNMPSRATFSYVPIRHRFLPSDLPEQDMNVEDPAEREDIMLAAYLSRIICRKLEIDAYSLLQKTLNQMSSIEPESMVQFIRELGLVLLTLRWRVSWWTVLGDGGKVSDRGEERFVYRVNSLCRILYFYYCSLRSKMSSWTDTKQLQGVWSNYADTSLPIYDDFPQENSIEGFHTWMEKGLDLISKARVADKLAGIGLKSEKA
jgi:hypothetical protein